MGLSLRQQPPNRAIPTPAMMDKCFGVISDIQHADVEDGFDVSGKKRRHYRNSLRVVSAASQGWREEKVKFVAQLGDIVDSKAKKNNSSNTDCENVLEQLRQSSAEYLVNTTRTVSITSHS